jgi:hypothetical protein
MKATFALLAIAATVAVAVAPAPALARTDPRGTTFITDFNTVAPQPVSHAHGYRFITDTLAPGGGKSLTAASNISFSWSDAGVGAATATGAILAFIGALLLLTHRRSSLAI